jgi:hypothetical protein
VPVARVQAGLGALSPYLFYALTKAPRCTKAFSL